MVIKIAAIKDTSVQVHGSEKNKYAESRKSTPYSELDSSPRMIAQRQMLSTAFGSVFQPGTSGATQKKKGPMGQELSRSSKGFLPT
jgi:hypothetical protein